MPIDRKDKSRLTEREAFLANFQYGNWTGASYGGGLYWTAGEFFTSDVLDNVDPIDSFDALSKWHDIAYDNAQMRQAVDMTLGEDPGIARTRCSLSIWHSDRVYLAQLPFHYKRDSHRTVAYRQKAYSVFQIKSKFDCDDVEDFLEATEPTVDQQPESFQSGWKDLAKRFDALRACKLLDRTPDYDAQPFMNHAFYRKMVETVADPSDGLSVRADGTLKTLNQAQLRDLIEDCGGIEMTTDPADHPVNQFVKKHRQDKVWVDDLSTDAQNLYLDDKELGRRRMYGGDR